jgi:hypothetical protein
METQKFVRVNNVAIETQQCVAIVLFTYKRRRKQSVIHTKSVAMEAQKFVRCIVALHMSLPKIWVALRSSCKQTDIFCQIITKSAKYLHIFVKVPIPNFAKTLPVGAAPINAYWRTRQRYGVLFATKRTRPETKIVNVIGIKTTHEIRRKDNKIRSKSNAF